MIFQANILLEKQIDKIIEDKEQSNNSVDAQLTNITSSLEAIVGNENNIVEQYRWECRIQ